MTLQRQLLLGAALLAVSAAFQTWSFLLRLQVQARSGDMETGLLVSAATLVFLWGGVIGTVLHALWPRYGQLPVRDWRASLPFYLIPTAVLALPAGAMLGSELHREEGAVVASRAFLSAADDRGVMPALCRDLPASGGSPEGHCLAAPTDGRLLVQLLQSALHASGGQLVGLAALPQERQGNLIQGRARVYLRAGMRRVPFTLEYRGLQYTSRVGPLTPLERRLQDRSIHAYAVLRPGHD